MYSTCFVGGAVRSVLLQDAVWGYLLLIKGVFFSQGAKWHPGKGSRFWSQTAWAPIPPSHVLLQLQGIHLTSLYLRFLPCNISTYMS